MQIKLPVWLVLTLLTFSFFIFLRFSSAYAQDSDSQISDFALDIQQGEKETVNNLDAQNDQLEVSQNEETQAAVDDGDPTTDPQPVTLDEVVAPEEAQESAKLIESLNAASSENDNGETLKDQSAQTSTEKPNEDVNVKDDNKAPSTDPDTQPQPSQAAEQPLENIQQLPDTDSQNETREGEEK